jgi:hypothetical protein
MEFILTHLDLSSFNSDKELLEEIAVNDQIVVQATIACVNIWEFFFIGWMKKMKNQSTLM